MNWFRLPTLFSILLLIFNIFCGCKKKSDANVSLPDISSNLVVHIALDGVAYDSVTHATGTNHNATPTGDRHGNANKAMHFNSTDSAYLDFSDLAAASISNSDAFTMACWVYVTDTNTNMAVMSKRGANGPFEYSIDNHFTKSWYNFDNWVPDGSTTVYGTDPLSASAPIVLNAWQHIAFVGSGQVMHAFANGVEMGTDARNGGNQFIHTVAPFVIGNGGGWGKNYFFNGSIDDVRIYNRALTTEQVKYLSSL